MRTFAQKQKPAQEAQSASSAGRGRAFSGQGREVRSPVRLQRSNGDQAAQRMSQADAEELEAGSTGAASPRFGHDFGRIPIRPPAAGAIRTNLAINKPGDEYEQEADRISEQVMRIPGPRLQRACTCGGDCPKCRTEQPGHVHQPLQNGRVQANNAAETVAPPIVHQVLRSPGRSLDLATEAFFEPRFGANFGSVRVHTDSAAAESAHAVNALAYTVGDHVVFANGQYAPGTPAGRRLLAHELTHVVQQQANGPATTVHRQSEDGPGGITGILEGMAENATAQLVAVANKPGPPSKFTNPNCPPTFCQPFANKDEAVADLERYGPFLLEAIGRKVNPKVKPLWELYLRGGATMQDLTADFGKDFTAAPTTAETTEFLLQELRKDMEENHAAGSPLDQAMPRFAAARIAINTPGDVHDMRFQFRDGIAGNVAGGIGADQRSVTIGALPSSVDDVRAVDLRIAYLEPNPDGSVTVALSLEFVIQDTIDLCPGDCGGTSEIETATIPLSRFEATGLAGDVPFVIRFPAPPEKLVPFVVGASPGPSP